MRPQSKIPKGVYMTPKELEGYCLYSQAARQIDPALYAQSEAGEILVPLDEAGLILNETDHPGPRSLNMPGRSEQSAVLFDNIFAAHGLTRPE